MLYAPDGSVVRATHARPERQPEAEERVRIQLKSIDSLLDVHWIPQAVYNPQDRTIQGRYALICRWPQGDPRWELYREGQAELPADMLGWFCEDIQDPESLPVSVDSIEQKVIELLAKCDATRIPHSTRMRQITEKNARLRTSRKAAVLDQTEEVARTLWNAVGKHDDATVQRIMKEIGEQGVS